MHTWRISIHALLAESDLGRAAVGSRMSKFLSTLSLRRATYGLCEGVSLLRNFYPRSPCGERRGTLSDTSDVTAISIHALLAESDLWVLRKVPLLSNFYPRSPCGERPIGTLRTVSVRNFYPRSPCGERPWARGSRVTYVEISIHALLAESDGGSGVGNWPREIFLSTLSLRRATGKVKVVEPGLANFYPRSPCGERRLDGRFKL